MCLSALRHLFQMNERGTYPSPGAVGGNRTPATSQTMTWHVSPWMADALHDQYLAVLLMLLIDAGLLDVNPSLFLKLFFFLFLWFG